MSEPDQQPHADHHADPGTATSWWARSPWTHLWVLLLFVLFTVAMTWPLARHLTDTLASWGDPVFQAWTLAWNVRAWTSEPLDVFNANVLYPYRNTLAYSDHLFGQTALIAPMMLLTDNPILVDNISRFIALTLTGFFTYLLVYDLTGNRVAGIVAGFAYAFIPNRLAHIEHLNILTAQYLPLIILAARRALVQRSVRWAVALGVILFVQGISGIYFLYFSGVLLLVVLVVYLFQDRTRESLVMMAKMIGVCAVAALLLVPTLWPYQQVSEDIGIERTPEDVRVWSAQWSDYLSVPTANRLYGDILGEQFHRDLEQDLFPGVLLVGLAGIGLLYRRLGWERWMLAALAAVSLVLSFGIAIPVFGLELPNPYRLFYEVVPGFRAIRVAARFGGHLMTLGLAGLGGLGVVVIINHGRQLLAGTSRQHLLAAGVGIVLIGGMAAEYSTRMELPEPLPTSLEQADRPDYAWMAEHPAPAIELPMGEGDVASAWPNYWSTMHWNDVVNGYSAIAPPAYYVFRDRMDQFPNGNTVEILQGMGVENVVYHSDPAVPPEEDPLIQGVEERPEFTGQVGAPDYVWTLEPDPWMWRLADAIPNGAGVDLPRFQDDQPLFGMLAAVLQRKSHTVYGEGTLDFWDIPDAPGDTCYAIIPADVAPANAGYEGADEMTTEGPLSLYRSARCDVDG